MFAEQICRDVLEIHGRLFDHRPVLQGHISNFVKEFEEKRGNREIDRLDSLHHNVSDMKKQLTESTTSLDTFLANIQAKLQVAVEVCKRIQEKENNVEVNFLEEERAKRRAEWDQFMQHQFEKSAQVDQDQDAEVQKIVTEYQELEGKLEHISSQAPAQAPLPLGKKRAMTQENRSSGFPTSCDKNWPVQSQKKGRRLKLWV